MPIRLFCSRGHHWEADAASTNATGSCPHCGAPGSLTDADSTLDANGAKAQRDTVTHLPRPDDGSLESIQVVSDSDTAGHARDDTSIVRPADAIPGYEILRELGRGGMGVVYEARQIALGRVVALKMILAGGHAGAKDLARFRTEAEAIARLQHPNIVQIHEVGEHDGKPYFSLEFCDSGNLSAQLRENPLPPREAAALVAKLALAMSVAHERGIIHRDLKPANVLLTGRGEPKITDFGLAKKMEEQRDLTHSGAIMGTPSYMAPEQALGDIKQIGPAADIYSLGAILYECVTGRPPFKAASTLETLDQVCHREPPPPSQLNPNVPRDLETICLKCLQKTPARRYGSALALADDLERYQQGKPIAARPISGLERLAKWVRRNPIAAALIVVLILGLAGSSLGAYVALRQRDRAIAAEAQRAEEQKQRVAEQHRRIVEAFLSSARTAAQRGDWQETLSSFDRAVAEGETLTAADQLLVIRALEASYRPRQALEELERRAAQGDLGDQAGAVDLYRGELLIGVDDAKAERLLHRALGQTLTPADRAYAGALLAKSMPEARDGFLKAIAADRFQRDARTQAGMLLYFEGRFDEASRMAEMSELLFPDHPDAQLLHAIIAATKGDEAAAQERLNRLVPIYGKEMIGALKNLIGLIPQLGRSLAANAGSIEEQPIGERFKLVVDQQRTAALTRALRSKDGEVERFPMFRVPPSMQYLKPVHDLLLQEMAASSKGEDYMEQIANDPKRMAKLEKLARDVPIGFVHFYHGNVLLMQSMAHLQKHGQDKRHAELLDASARAFEQALREPGFIDVRLVSMDGFILTRGFRGSPKYAHPDPVALKSSVAMIHRRLAIAPFPRARYEIVLKVLKYANEWNVARTLLDQWMKPGRQDLFLQTWRAEVEFGAGNWTEARKWARSALAVQTANVRMKEIAAECDKRIQAASKE